MYINHVMQSESLLYVKYRTLYLIVTDNTPISHFTHIIKYQVTRAVIQIAQSYVVQTL